MLGQAMRRPSLPDPQSAWSSRSSFRATNEPTHLADPQWAALEMVADALMWFDIEERGLTGRNRDEIWKLSEQLLESRDCVMQNGTLFTTASTAIGCSCGTYVLHTFNHSTAVVLQAFPTG